MLDLLTVDQRAVDELSDILRPSLSGELDARLGDLGGCGDVPSLLQVEIITRIVALGWQDITVLDPLEGHSRRRRLLLPDFEMTSSLFGLLLPLLLGLTLDEDLLLVWWAEGRDLVAHLRLGAGRYKIIHIGL